MCLWRVHWLQCCILKPGRSPTEIKPVLYLLTLVFGWLAVAILVALL